MMDCYDYMQITFLVLNNIGNIQYIWYFILISYGICICDCLYSKVCLPSPCSVRNKDAKVVGQMSEHFEFGSDIFNLGCTLFVWTSMSHMYNVEFPLKFTPPIQVPCSM